MKRILLITAVVALLSGCATKSAVSTSISVRIPLKGTEPFCIYGPSWSIDGMSPRFAARPYDSKYCTDDKPRPDDGTYRGQAGGGLFIAGAQYSRMTVTFRRSMDGPQEFVEFDLRGKLSPPEGWGVSSLTPVVTNSRIDLIRIDRRPQKDPRYSEFRDVVIDSKELR